MNAIQINDKVRAQIKEYRLPGYNEIPNVGLFLEQAAKFISEYIEPLEGITITGSMISNYVKKKLIANPVKKQYYREQIAEVIFIALVKSVISLEEAEKMLKIRREAYSAQDAYEYFCKEFKKALCTVFEAETDVEEDRENETIEKELLRKTVTAVAYKVYLNEAFKMVE